MISYIHMTSTYPIYEQILKDRGLTKGEIEEFLNPVYDEVKGGMYDASRMKDIGKATDRIWKAIESKEKICIYADYDADGVPGAVVLYDFFKKINYAEHVQVKIPHRHKDGFGLHTHLIDEVSKEGVGLLITIDLGISNVKEVAHANSLGIDVIITDHHLPHEELPQAYAILNPKQSDCGYLEKMLCGSGVVFKLVHRLVDQARARGFVIAPGWEKWSLDLVGLATISDMVPLTGENRVFATYGLKVIQKNKRIGLACLLSELKINSRDIQEDDIGFSISPCINAASRMSHAIDAFQLFSVDSQIDAVGHAKKLVVLNKSRKEKAQVLVASADTKVKQGDVESGILVVGDETWLPTLVGPVASNLVRKFQVPTFVYGCDDGEVYRGSCRSIPGISVVEIMARVTQDFFIESGGHAMSGGFAFTKDKADVLEQVLREAFVTWKKSKEQNQSEEDLLPVLDIPVYSITHDKINDMFVSDLKKLRPFGIGNEKPLFRIPDVVLREIKKFGKAKEHVEFFIDTYTDVLGATQSPRPDFMQDVHLYSETHRRVTPVRYISFFSDQSHHDAQPGVLADVYGYVEESFFLGKREIRVRVEKIVYKV